MNYLASALQMAAAGLAMNIASVGGKQYALGGAHQYAWVWSRDFAWSTPGLLDAGHAQAVHDTLELILGFQREDGYLPRDVDDRNIVLRFVPGLFGFPPALRPPFRPGYISENGVLSLDTCTLIPWAADEYIERTGDRAFAEKWWPAAVKSLGYLEKNFFDGGLVAKQPPHSDWEDSVKRVGRVGYTNATYVMALQAMSRWAGFLGRPEDEKAWAGKAEAARKRFVEVFWDDKNGRVRNFDGDERLAADANLLAVAHGLLSPEQARKAMETLRASALWKPLPGRVTTPDYTWSMISRFCRFSGNRHYHDEQYWLWITALAAQAERAVGAAARCRAILQGEAGLVLAHGGVYEDYDLTDRGLVPVRQWIYKAEMPMTWNSATFIHTATLGCTK